MERVEEATSALVKYSFKINPMELSVSTQNPTNASFVWFAGSILAPIVLTWVPETQTYHLNVTYGGDASHKQVNSHDSWAI